MTVTKIAEISRSRSKVYIDSEFAFVLHKGELSKYHICAGEEIPEDIYRTILQEVLSKRAKLRCMNLLKERDYTESRLKQKLKLDGYPEEVIEEAVRYVASYRYIDDLRYAESYIAQQSDKRSRRRIEQDLQNRGVSGTDIAAAWQRFEEAGGGQDEQAMIAKLLEKRHYDPENTDYKERQKHYAFLLRRGYSPQQIRKALCVDEADLY